jgi:hypothetical protein
MHIFLALQPPLRPNNQWDFTMEYYAGKFVISVVILTVRDGTWTMCWVDFAGFISISTLTFNIWGTCSLVSAVMVGSCVLVVEDYCSKISWRSIWSKPNHIVIFRSRLAESVTAAGSCVLVVEDYCSKINWRSLWSKPNHIVIFRSCLAESVTAAVDHIVCNSYPRPKSPALRKQSGFLGANCCTSGKMMPIIFSSTQNNCEWIDLFGLPSL